MKERSIFWPLVLIATGILWLMVSLDMLPRENLWALTHIFPFLLIALGVGLILRAYVQFAGMVVSLLVVAGAVMAVFYAPQLGWNKAPGWSWYAFDLSPGIGGGVAGSGVIETEKRNVSDFDAISIKYPADIIIEQGNSTSVIIEADDNLLPQLSTEIRGGTLIFDNIEHNWGERVNPSETVLLTITVEDLKDISFSSAGKLLIEDLKTDSLEISVSGAGDIDIIDLDAKSLGLSLSGAGSVDAEGITDELNIRISGMGSFNGEDLETLDASVHISGAGSATLWAIDRLDASISGAGSVNYYGDPEVSKSTSGVGSITGLGDK